MEGYFHLNSTMRYHAATIKLLGFEPVFGKLSLPDLPASVEEWYSLEQAEGILEQYSNMDKPLSPNNFRYEIVDHHQVVVFLVENQGVCWWAFESGKGADPPVYVIFESSPRRWMQYCERFSTFIYTRIFDYRYWDDEKRSRMEIGYPLSEQVLKSLRNDYLEHPKTFGWPGDRQYRFSKDDKRIVLMESAGQTDWYFSADTVQAVDEIYQEYRHLLY